MPFFKFSKSKSTIQSIVVCEGIESLGVGSLGALMGLQKVILPSSFKSNFANKISAIV